MICFVTDLFISVVLVVARGGGVGAQFLLQFCVGVTIDLAGAMYERSDLSSQGRPRRPQIGFSGCLGFQEGAVHVFCGIGGHNIGLPFADIRYTILSISVRYRITPITDWTWIWDWPIRYKFSWYWINPISNIQNSRQVAYLPQELSGLSPLMYAAEYDTRYLQIRKFVKYQILL